MTFLAIVGFAAIYGLGFVCGWVVARKFDGKTLTVTPDEVKGKL